MTSHPILAVNVGNSRTQFARFDGEKPAEGSSVRSLPNDPREALRDALLSELRAIADGDAPPVLVACSVNPPVAEALEREIRAALPAAEFLLVRREVPLTLTHSLDEQGEKTVGADRLCTAIGAYALVQQACVVVDAGSAVTVDFVDGAGVFHGGAIAPGARMMLRALHERTASLPNVEFAAPEGVGSPDVGAELQPFGRNTPQAILNGVYFAITGLVRRLTERYAEKYEAYPIVLATGGDAPTLFEHDELVERIVPDLTLRGVAAAFHEWANADNEDAAPATPTEARDIRR